MSETSKRSVAGSILVLAAAIVLAAALLASHLGTRTGPDEETINILLVIGSFVVGAIDCSGAGMDTDSFGSTMSM